MGMMAPQLIQTLRQTQRLIMTPQMQQSIQLLQLNSLELEQLIDTEMLENPFLEIEEEPDEEPPALAEIESAVEETSPETASAPEETAESTETPTDIVDLPAAEAPAEAAAADGPTFDDVDVNWDDLFSDAENATYTPPPSDSEDHDFTQYTASRSSLLDHLMRQLRLSAIEGADYEIAEFIIGCVDEDGYLSESVEHISDEIGARPEDIQRILDILQTLDPAGVFARDLAECLLLQIRDLGDSTPLIEEVLTEHFDKLIRKRFREIAKAVDAAEDEIVKLFNKIRLLEPKPGREQTKEQARYISPDVYVKDIDGECIYTINEGGGQGLRISKFYRDLLRDKDGAFSGEAREYAKERFRSAVMLMKNIEKRKSTVLRVTEAIMEHQSEFLEKGIVALKPLTLREIAEIVGMHEATISRVTSGKYVETPQGLFELKFFFSSGIESRTGEATSSRAIKDMIADMIDSEDPQKPLSDEKLAVAIHDKGFTIARRTVAKYREQMKILPAKLRREST